MLVVLVVVRVVVKVRIYSRVRRLVVGTAASPTTAHANGAGCYTLYASVTRDVDGRARRNHGGTCVAS